MTTTIALFKNRLDAEHAIGDLRREGVHDEEISYAYLDREERIARKKGSGERVVEGAVGGVVTGAIVGALAGLVVANGILPGLGSLFVGGTLASTLGLTGAAATAASGAITGAATLGIIGALASMGVSQKDAKVYEKRIKSGDILVTTTTPADTTAKNVFEQNHAEEIRIYNK